MVTRAWGYVVAVAVMLASAHAQAYVRAHDGSGRLARWHSPRIELRLYAPPQRPESSTIALAALRRAAATWAAASGIEFSVAEPSAGRGRVAEDGINAVVMNHAFCAAPARLDKNCGGRPVAALTHAYSRPDAAHPGRAETIEADIELDGRRFIEAAPDVARALEAVLLHELGHVLGLDHVCFATRLGSRTDHAGAQAPRCAAGAPAVLDTVMYPDPLDARFGGHLELGPDELLALRDVYGRPAAARADSWPPLVGLGAVAGGAALSAAGLWRYRRRRQQR